MLQQNFAYLLERRAFLHPSDTAVVDADTGCRYSYGELVRRSCRLAHALKDRGIGRGDRICCLTKNSVEYIDLFMAAARLGAMLCPVNYRLAVVVRQGLQGTLALSGPGATAVPVAVR